MYVQSSQDSTVEYVRVCVSECVSVLLTPPRSSVEVVFASPVRVIQQSYHVATLSLSFSLSGRRGLKKATSAE